MQTAIRPYVQHCDLEYFVDTEFDAAIDAGMVSVGEDEQAAKAEHRNELMGFIDESPRTGIFIAQRDASRVGLVWVSERSTGEPWDLGPAIGWIYDIRVHESARRHGLGTQLLARAEDWAREAGYPAIGLHVFGHNDPARALYASCGFSVLNTYVQGTDLSSFCRNPSECEAWVLGSAASIDGDDAIDDLFVNSFRRRALHTWGQLDDATIRDGYQQSVSSYERTKRDDVTLLVRRTADDRVVGLARAYVSSGDLGAKRYAWMTDLAVASDTDTPGVSRTLLGGIARWAGDRDLDTLRTSVHALETDIYKTLVDDGFKDTNVFLRKLIPR